jgi:hypothetical protein
MAIAPACSKSPATQTAMAFPDSEVLPIQGHQDCKCQVNGNCSTLEMADGYLEVSRLQCRWKDAKKSIADCQYEIRSTTDYNGQVVSSAWQTERSDFAYLGKSRWCRI